MKRPQSEKIVIKNEIANRCNQERPYDKSEAKKLSMQSEGANGRRKRI